MGNSITDAFVPLLDEPMQLSFHFEDPFVGQARYKGRQKSQAETSLKLAHQIDSEYLRKLKENIRYSFCEWRGGIAGHSNYRYLMG